jgi:hypothetical protein
MEGTPIFDCQACEAALSDYLDRALSPELRRAFQTHLRECPACAEFERDVREGMAALSEAEPVEPSPILVNKILFQIPHKPTGWKKWLGRFFEPVFQPRVVMGAMMTVLSLAMMTRCAGVPSRSLTASDLDPVKVWGAFDDRLHRTWDRTVMAYDSMRLVYEVRARVRQWRQGQDEQENSAAAETLKTKQLPAHTAGSGNPAEPNAQRAPVRQQ